jgi:hypothetical protein
MSRLTSRRAYGLLTATVVATAIAFPLGVIATHQFGDVPDSNPYHNDIAAIANAGVTSGCGGGNYCPSAYVTREQMAAFMNRLGALSAGKQPVVNAIALNGIQSFGYQQLHASDSWVVDFPMLAAGACDAEQVGSVAAHGAHVLVSNPFDEASANGTTWLVTGYRKANAETDEIWAKVCNVGNVPADPPSATFKWSHLK